MNDETAYYAWVLIVPDEWTDDDIEDICQDENIDIFRDCCVTFREIIKDYGDSGFYLGNKVY